MLTARSSDQVNSSAPTSLALCHARSRTLALADLKGTTQDTFRFLQVSTDEVYSSLTDAEPAVGEDARYALNSPYSASKAASDHLVRADPQTIPKRMGFRH
jgi:dTDP-D-glucose 4,6-dehydratase